MSKKHQHMTWYVLVDGTNADPNYCAPGPDGVLRHENGVPVALHEDGTPMSVGVAALENKNVEAAAQGEVAAEMAEQQRTDDAAVETEAGDAVVTEIDPATGQPADETAQADSADEKAKNEAKEAKPAPAKRYKTRQAKAR